MMIQAEDRLVHAVRSRGFGLVPGVIQEGDRLALIKLLGTVHGPGRRGLVETAKVRELASSEHLVSLVRSHLDNEPRPVRIIYFDKSADVNWLVPWHQDLTVCVSERHEVANFGPWSCKDGMVHVQPPTECLEAMVTLRLHLDAADETNGALRVLPGTHREGRLAAERIQQLRGEVHEQLCVAQAGDALLMRPLLLHASSKSISPTHRRVLHIEYAGFTLPPPLRWYEAA